jgi:Mg-chelatase subunit ChlD
MIGRLISRHEGSNLKIDMVDYIVTGQQIDTFCNVTILQKFVNNTGKLLECSYVFPNDNKFCIYDTEFVINDKIIRPELRAKEEAKKEYDEAVSQGHTAMFGHDRGDGTIEFKLGNLHDKKEVEIHVKASFMCTCTDNGVSLKFPLSAKFQQGKVTSSAPENVNFQLKVNIHQNSSDIKSIKCSVNSETNKIDEKTSEVHIKEIPNSDAIFIETELTEGVTSQAISSDGYICITAFPSFEAKVESNSEFVFVVDCSGSMWGNRISNAAKCMKIFIRSLPENCKFSIWRFGSTSECMVPSCDYTKENIDRAASLIAKLDADLGGTNLLDPLVRIMSSEPPEGFTRQMFVLTDGEIGNTKDVLGQVRARRGNNRIFSIGLGTGADSGLITGLAEIANGKGIHVDDDDKKLTEKVIGMLEAAIQPAMSNVSIICEGMTEQWPSPAPAIYNHSQQNIIIKSPYQEYVLISGSVAGENIDETIPVNKAADGIGLKELFMFKAIEDLQYDIRINQDESKKAKVIEYSLASRVLSEYTAYVGIDFSPLQRKEMINRQKMRSYKGAAPKRKLFMGAAPEYKLCAAPRHLIDDALECGKVEESHKKPDTSKKAPGRSAPMRQAQKRRAASPEPESSESDDQSEKHESEVEKLINEQNPDGSWDSSTKINEELVKKYNQKVAATIASIAIIRKNSGSALNSFKFIIKFF